jgi:hypothetical protein
VQLSFPLYISFEFKNNKVNYNFLNPDHPFLQEKIMESHADILFSEPKRRLSRGTFTEIFGPSHALVYIVIRTHSHPVYGLTDFLGIGPISEELRKKKFPFSRPRDTKIKMITVSDQSCKFGELTYLS